MISLSAEGPLETLLRVQAADLIADQLHHRREAIAERALRAEQLGALGSLEEERRVIALRLEGLEQAQGLRQIEIDAITAKIADIERAMHTGKVNSPRDLQAMQDEVEALTRRRSGLEDTLLELMEEAEPLGAALAEIETTTAARRAEVERLDLVITEASRVLDKELAEVAAERANLAAGVPEDLLGTYERLRARLGGVGVARLEEGRCLGCHLTLPSVELDAIRHAPEGGLHFHEECGRLLVR